MTPATGVRLLLIVAGLQVATACSASPQPEPPVDGPVVELNPGLNLECRGVDEDTCLGIGRAAVNELPPGAVAVSARLAPAQFCLGDTPCIQEPMECRVHASVVFYMHAIDRVVFNVIGVEEDLQVTHWDGPVDLGEDPINDDVGGFCISGPGVP